MHAANHSHVDTVMVAGQFRKQHGKLLKVDLGRVRRAAEASLAHLFAAVGYIPNVLEDRFPSLAGEKPAAWTGG